jgi:hypothetical protein
MIGNQIVWSETRVLAASTGPGKVNKDRVIVSHERPIRIVILRFLLHLEAGAIELL